MDSLLEDRLTKGGKTPTNLTRRETEVLRFILSGKTNKDMARILCRAERTVEYHRNRLMRKLGVHNVAELVKCAIAMGIA
jgi:DNA-binding NarL/FixJ family response regulator